LYDIVLLIIPRTLLAAEYASWHCLDGLRSALSCTPKSFSSLTDSSRLPSMKYWISVIVTAKVHDLALRSVELHLPYFCAVCYLLKTVFVINAVDSAANLNMELVRPTSISFVLFVCV